MTEQNTLATTRASQRSAASQSSKARSGGGTKRTLIAPSAEIAVPMEVAVCPICGSHLTAQMEAWTQRDDGTWGPGETPSLQCPTEPDLDSNEWDDWFDGHYAMPYVDWLPVAERVQKWIDQQFDFDMEETG
jgi:hypothetical protein